MLELIEVVDPASLIVGINVRATAKPKTLRYRLLHVAARLTRGQRRLWLRIDRHWPWATNLAAAFASLATLPTPTG